jgi:predicted Zn-dependent protease
LLQINPKNAGALNNIASICADDFDPPRITEGLGYIQRARDILNARGASDYNMDDTYGWLLILGGQTQEGMNVLQEAVKKAQFPEGYYHLAEGYLRLNQPDAAQQAVTSALQAIAAAQKAKQPVSSTIRAKIEDLSSRVLDSLRPRTSGNVP